MNFGAIFCSNKSSPEKHSPFTNDHWNFIQSALTACWAQPTPRATSATTEPRRPFTASCSRSPKLETDRLRFKRQRPLWMEKGEWQFVLVSVNSRLKAQEFLVQFEFAQFASKSLFYVC